MTCNKLSHCLFDFDCQDFNTQYETEKYFHQEFNFENILHSVEEPSLLTSLDVSFHRKEMDTKFVENKVTKWEYLTTLDPNPDQPF